MLVSAFSFYPYIPTRYYEIRPKLGNLEQVLPLLIINSYKIRQLSCSSLILRNSHSYSVLSNLFLSGSSYLTLYKILVNLSLSEKKKKKRKEIGEAIFPSHLCQDE